MSQTLKEFTEKHIKADTVGYMAKWRKVFPTELRNHNRAIKYPRWFGPTYVEVLEEKWERIHKGDVIDTEWREIAYENDDFDY